MNTPQVSVIVLAWNGIDYLEPCLEALLAQDYADLEVIAVDNGSTDGSPDFVAKHFPQARLIRNERNLGFAAGNNVGLKAATGDLWVLLNQDTEVRPGWLTALVRAFDDPVVGIAGCKLFYPDGTIQHAGGYLYGPRGESAHTGRHAHDDGSYDEPNDAEFVTAAALAIRATALEQIGPLDEAFAPAYYEDVDWCFRAKQAGFRVVYQPQAIVTHHESTATVEVSHDRKYALHQGRLRLVCKHWPLDRLLNEFGPAEMTWVAAMDRTEELMAARRAYLNTILNLPGILAFRKSSSQESDAIVGLLAALRATAVAGLVDGAMAEGTPPSESVVAVADQERARLLHTIRENQTINEHVFASDVPVIGRLIVAIRNLWGSVAARWLVQPIIQQQSILNAQIASYLLNVEQRLQGQSRDVAENIRELTALAERLADLARQSDRES